MYTIIKTIVTQYLNNCKLTNNTHSVSSSQTRETYRKTGTQVHETPEKNIY